MPFTLISLAQLLKSETLDQHQAAEHLLYPKLDGIATEQDYSDILKTFYGFYAPLEKIIASLISCQQLPDIEERKNSSLIINDLSALGENVGDLPLCKSLPQINTSAQAFGALYVMEGSTLGGRMIRKMILKKHAGLIHEDQLNFFNGYGEDTSLKWKTFQSVLDKVDNKEAAVTTANETFTLFQKWIKEYLYDELYRA